MGLNIENMGLYRWLMVGLLAYKFYRTDFKKRSRVAFKPEFNFSRTIEKNWNYICILIFNFIHRFHTKTKIFSQSLGHADYPPVYCPTVLEKNLWFNPSADVKNCRPGSPYVLWSVHRFLEKMTEFKKCINPVPNRYDHLRMDKLTVSWIIFPLIVIFFPLWIIIFSKSSGPIGFLQVRL